MTNKEIDKLVEILSRQKDKYSEKQIKNAILAEGYSEDTAKEVLAKIYIKDQKLQEQTRQELKQERPNNRQERTIQKESKQNTTQEIQKQEQNIDYYSEVNALLSQLKEINKIKKPEISTPNLLKETNQFSNLDSNLKSNNTNNVAINLNDLNKQIEMKKQELQKIKIETDDDIKIVTKDGKIINLNNYPRREWRNYKTDTKTIAETKEEKMQKLRQEIYALKKLAGRNQEVTQEEKISESIKERVKQKAHGRLPENRIDIEAKNEAEKLREKYKSEEIKRQDLDTAADNIYIQMTRNPNIYDNDNQKENKTDNKKKDNEKKETKNENQNTDLNIDSGSYNNSSDSNNSDLDSEFNLGLDLNSDDK